MLESAYMNMNTKEMKEFVNFFKALSDRTRLRIINILKKARSSLCVCEIMDSLKESQYNVSRHLKVLKSAGLVKERKEGRWVVYSLSSSKNKFHKIILEAVSAIPEGLFSDDFERLEKRISLRKEGKCIIGMNSEEWKRILRKIEWRRRGKA